MVSRDFEEALCNILEALSDLKGTLCIPKTAVLGAALIMSAAFALVVCRQGNGSPLKPTFLGPMPQMTDGKHDLSGIWLRERIVNPGTPEMLPWATALVQRRQADKLVDMPSARCLPMGVTLLGPTLTKFIQTSSVLVAL